MGLNHIPRILWGASFANTLEIGYPLDNPEAYGCPAPGYEVKRATSGETDAWTPGTDQFLEGDCRRIPTATGTTPEGIPITGWDGATGWNEFLKWSRDANVIRFVPDRGTPGTFVECYLDGPDHTMPPGREPADFTRHVRIKVRSVNASAFTGY